MSVVMLPSLTMRFFYIKFLNLTIWVRISTHSKDGQVISNIIDQNTTCNIVVGSVTLVNILSISENDWLLIRLGLSMSGYKPIPYIVSRKYLILLMISVTHSTCGVLCTVSWRGVRGCLNNVSGCYCKI